MVTVVKHEWHQVDSQFAFELEKDLLEEIYPDMDEDEITSMLEQIENGEISVDELSEKVKRATVLIAVCKEKLFKTEDDVNQILKDLEAES